MRKEIQTIGAERAEQAELKNFSLAQLALQKKASSAEHKSLIIAQYAQFRKISGQLSSDIFFPIAALSESLSINS